MNLDLFVQGYLDAALWSSTDEDDDALEDNFTPADISPETAICMRADCTKFVAANRPDLEQYCLAHSALCTEWSDEEMAGHDFWLTRNGHGAGFWDRDWADRETLDRLSDAAAKFGEYHLYVGDDGSLFGMKG